jgi:hypothetical protein
VCSSLSPYPYDAAQPCFFPPGSEGKIACLAARRARGLPLFHPGDRRGLRQLNDTQPSSRAPRSGLERRVLTVLTWSEQPVAELAALIGVAPGQRLSRVLWNLRDEGLARRGEEGWRLAGLLGDHLIDDPAAHRNRGR